MLICPKCHQVQIRESDWGKVQLSIDFLYTAIHIKTNVWETILISATNSPQLLEYLSDFPIQAAKSSLDPGGKLILNKELVQISLPKQKLEQYP